MKGFIPNDSSENEEINQHTPFCIEASKRLANKLISIGIIDKSPSINKWATEFALLRMAHSPKEIKAVLKWYMPLIGRTGLPHAFSAKSFRIKFKEIKSAMLRSDAIPKITITEQAQRLTNQLTTEMSWRCDRAKIEYVAQMSIDAFITFVMKVRAFSKANPDQLPVPGYPNRTTSGTPHGRFAAHLLETHFPLMHTNAILMEMWFEPINKMVLKWTDWDGRFERYIFDPKSKRFQIRGWNIAFSWTCRVELWDSFMKELYEN